MPAWRLPGFKLVQRDVGPLVLELARRKISVLARLMTTFLTQAKTANLSLDELATRARRSGDPARGETFLSVYQQVRDRYEQMLADEGAIDFHDLINRAVRNLREGRWRSPFKYILVDEFQDISSGRMRLLQALAGDDVTFFLVGDDWQSIYRFAGSDVSLMRDCQHYLGHVQHRNLSRTWRFGKGILGPSSAFVQRNPEQTRRTLNPADVPEDRGITVIFDSNPANALQRALHDIRAIVGGEDATVLVLGLVPEEREASAARDASVPGSQSRSPPCTARRARRRTTWLSSTSGIRGQVFRRRSRTIPSWNWYCHRSWRGPTRWPRSAGSSMWR